MLRFRCMHTLQKSASIHASVHNHFPTERDLQNLDHHKQTRAAALTKRRDILAA
jgi:putative transposase